MEIKGTFIEIGLCIILPAGLHITRKLGLFYPNLNFVGLKEQALRSSNFDDIIIKSVNMHKFITTITLSKTCTSVNFTCSRQQHHLNALQFGGDWQVTGTCFDKSNLNQNSIYHNVPILIKIKTETQMIMISI